jgi:hypothetical protein
MCVAAAPAHFSETILYHGHCHHPSHGRVHVLGYQNVAANHAPGPNAMLLHLPGAGMSQDNFVDTSGSRGILTDMTSALGPPISVGYGAVASRSAPPVVQVFEHDIYTVVLAANAALVPEALRLVPERRRIPANPGLFEFYARMYPDYAVALCCFDNRDAARSAPLLLWYEPLQPDRAELPAIDCHTGGVPDIGGPVEVDHWVILGTDEEHAPSGGEWSTARMSWSEEVLRSPAGPFLPAAITGRTYTGIHPNGDFMIPSSDLMEGRMTAMRRVGPGGARLTAPEPPPPRRGPRPFGR